MVLLSCPIAIPYRPITKSFICFPKASNTNYPHPQDNLHTTSYSKPTSIRWNSSLRHEKTSLVPLHAKDSAAPGQEDNRALETVLKFYTAIKNRNIHELSEVLGDECHCFSNFISFVRPFAGKNQVLGFLSFLLVTLGNNIEFVIKPTLHDGMSVGVEWKLECNKTHVPLGKGFSFHVCQTYQGKVLIRNVEMFLEPLLHIEPLRLKMIQYVTNFVSKIFTYIKSEGKARRAAHALLALSLMAAALVTIKHILH